MKKRARPDLNRRPNAPQSLLLDIEEQFQTAIRSISWDDYKKWLYDNKNKYYARTLFRGSKNWHEYAFSTKLVELQNNRRKGDMLRAITNLTRYIDIKNDTYFHEEFLKWMKRKELSWKVKNDIKITEEIPISTILDNMKQIPEKYQIFGIFTLVSGLRTFECIKVLNNHEQLCKNGIIEMYWDRKTKKSNAVYCHPLLHNKLKFKYHESTIHRNLTTKMLGCKIKYLRKINFTKIATEVDPLLAEFMQGRRGNVSQRHYFLPTMSKHKKKWASVWEPLIRKLII